MNHLLPTTCTLFMIAARLSASPPQADEAFPPPANAAERTKIELELSKPPTPRKSPAQDGKLWMDFVPMQLGTRTGST